MNQYLAQLKEWFAALAPRERVMVSVGAVFTLFALIYLIAWQPLVDAHLRREKSLTESRALASRLEVIAAEAQKSHMSGNPNAAASRNLSLLSAVDQSSKSGVLSKPPSRLQPDGEHAVKVWLEDVTFDSLVRWIAELETRYGVSADTVDIEKQSAPGLVNARLSLTRP